MKRLVLYGPPLAGKSTILQSFAEANSLATQSFAIQPEGQSFAERGYRVFDGSAFVAETIAGAVWSMNTWMSFCGERGTFFSSSTLNGHGARSTVNMSSTSASAETGS